MRVFALGLVFAFGCSSSGADPGMVSVAGAGAGGSESGLGGGGLESAGSPAAGAAGDAASAGSGTSGDGNAGASQGGAGGLASSGGAQQGGGAPSGGSSSPGGSAGASAGAAGIPDGPGPFTVPGCAGYEGYRVPPGKWLAIWGDFTVAATKPGSCTVPANPTYVRCATATNAAQCDCTPGKQCSDACFGHDLITAVQAEPGKSYTVELRDGQGACVAGVPTKTN